MRFKLTLFRLTDLIFGLHLCRLASLFYNKGHLHLGVETNVGVADNMQNKGVVSGLRGGSELSLESLHVESGLALIIHDGLVKLGKVERRNSHLALLGIAKESMPLGRVIASVVGSVCERGENRLFFNGDELAVRSFDSLLLAAID